MGCAGSKQVGSPTKPVPDPGKAPLEIDVARGAILRLPASSVKGLVAHDFARLFAEKVGAHLPGTREWAFTEILTWLNTVGVDVSQLFWLMGGGGTGKTVLTAALLERTFDRVVAWHFCRHDNPEASAPASMLRSLAAMLCVRLPGFADALGALPNESLQQALSATEPKEIFAALFEAPLKQLDASRNVPEQPMLIILDALDELPKEALKPMLGVIAVQLAQLPSWLRLFVTSREEAAIQNALRKFNPRELRADEANNRMDVQVYLRHIARTHVQGQLSMADVEEEVKRVFNVDMKDKLTRLQKLMDSGREIYETAAKALSNEAGYYKLVHDVVDLRPELRQVSDDFDVVYAQAVQARESMRKALADEWYENPEGSYRFNYPVESKKQPWVDSAVDPGIKGVERAKQKMEMDYDGHANKLKDLARMTIVCASVERMLEILSELKKSGFKVVLVKNKYLSPTPMGYRDLNLIVEISLPTSDGGLMPYYAEVQVNHEQMLAAKAEAHQFYETVRTDLPDICKGTGADPDKLEAFIVSRLNTSALDAAVSALAAKADGLFLYAHLLAQHLESEAAAGRPIDFGGIDELPSGLAEVYSVNFSRAFPGGADDPGWAIAKPLVSLVSAAMEPITPAMAGSLLGWDAAQKELVLEATGLLFPVRDGKFHVFHKTIIDWLTGNISAGSSIKARSETFQVQRSDGHAVFAEGFLKSKDLWRGRVGTKTDESLGPTEYWLKHGLLHLCRAGRATDAAELYVTDLSLLMRRVEAGLLTTIPSDYLELSRSDLPDGLLAGASQMRNFVAKYRSILDERNTLSVLQLASQQPDVSLTYKAFSALSPEGPLLTWHNKPHDLDACIATLTQAAPVVALAVSETQLVCGAGNRISAYSIQTQELLLEMEGNSSVQGLTMTNEVIVAGYLDGTIDVWNSQKPELIVCKPNAHTALTPAGGVVNAMPLDKSPDGVRVLSGGGDDGALRIWEIAGLGMIAGKERAHPKGQFGAVAACMHTPDGLQVVSAGNFDKAIKIWDASSLTLLREKTDLHSNWIYGLALSPDASTIVTGSRDYSIRVWDFKTLEMLADKPDVHFKAARGTQYNPDGTSMVSFGSNDKTIKIWKSGTFECLAAAKDAHSKWIKSLVFLAGAKIVTGSEDATVKIWDEPTLLRDATKTIYHTQLVRSVAISPDASRIVSISDDKTMKLWDAATMTLIGEKPEAATCPEYKDIGHYMSVAKDGSVVTGTYDGTLVYWEPGGLEPRVTAEKAHDGWIRALCHSADGSMIVSGSADKTLRLSDAESLKLIAKQTDAHTSAVSSAAFSASGLTVVSSSRDGSLKLWQVPSLAPLAAVDKAHDGSVTGVRFCMSGSEELMLSCGDDCAIKLWNSASLQPIMARESAHTSWIVAIATCSGKVVSCASDRSMRLWSVTTLEEVAMKVDAHDGNISTVAFSQDGAKIITGGYDNSLKVWNASTLELLAHRDHAHASTVNVASFNHDGSRIISYSYDKWLKMWDGATLTEVMGGPPVVSSSSPFDEKDPSIFFISTVSFSQDGTELLSTAAGWSKTWSVDALEELKSESSADVAFSGASVEEVIRIKGSTLQTQEGGIFYAPSTLMCSAARGNTIVAGALSGELYFLEPSGRRVPDAVTSSPKKKAAPAKRKTRGQGSKVEQAPPDKSTIQIA